MNHQREFAVWQPRGVGGGSKVQERGCVYTYGWFMLMHGRNQHYCKAVILQLKNKYFLAILISSIIFVQRAVDF